jgi:hypothetical protein
VDFVYRFIVFNITFNNISVIPVAVSFIGGGNQRKPTTYNGFKNKNSIKGFLVALGTTAVSLHVKLWVVVVVIATSLKE